MQVLRALLIIAIAPTLWAFGNKEIPSWVQAMASRKMPAFSGKVPAVVLTYDQHVTFDASGSITTTERRVIKILNEQGKREAVARVRYWKNRRDVKDLHAWLIAPNGFEKTFEKNDVLDVGAFREDELYSDGRMRVITANSPEVGSVFAYEYSAQEKVFMAQDQFLFQDELPVVQARYTLTLPAGWTAKGVVLNHAPIEPMVEGSTYIWELKDLPYREAEDESAATLPRLAVSFVPPAGGSPGIPALITWSDVSKLQSTLAEGQDEVTPEISAKVAQLTAGAKTDYEKLCAIGHYVQNIRYVAIQMNLENGGGYVPHAAGMVFNKQYGDCKDKANLMRCMLKAAGIGSHLVVIFSGDRTYVRPEWPSPQQFNHMILGAKITESPADGPTITTPVGRLVIFDPTDEKTPVGDLPSYLQGSYALVLANERGDLFKMPVRKAEANLADVKVDATLDEHGQMTASFAVERQGQMASLERHWKDRGKADDYKHVYERFLNEQAKGSVISKFEPQDHFDQNKFDLKLDFAAQDFGQLMQGRLLVFNPGVVPIFRTNAPWFTKEAKRASPIILNAAVYRKTVRLKLPTGFAIDEAPLPAHYDTDYAKFSLTFKQEPGVLVVNEELRTEAATLPPDQFSKVKEFFDNCHGADRQKIVLAKQ